MVMVIDGDEFLMNFANENDDDESNLKLSITNDGLMDIGDDDDDFVSSLKISFDR